MMRIEVPRQIIGAGTITFLLSTLKVEYYRLRGMSANERPFMESDLTAQVHNMADMVAYQDGSVVSREIIGKSTGTVTLFAFDKGQGLSEHTAPFDALVFLLDGAAEITIAGKPFHLKQGEMIIMPANQPHALKAREKFKMALIMIKA
jgi:quercetin dioxygenase-like cupin family protein